MAYQSDYAFASSYLRTQEKNILSSNNIERMVQAPSAQKAFDVLHDLDYAKLLSGLDHTTYKVALDKKLENMRKTLIDITPEEKLMPLIFLRYNFHNIKLLFKAKMFEKPYKQYFSRIGSLDIKKLELLIIKDEHVIIEPHFQELITQAKEDITAEFTPHDIDRYFEKKQLTLGLALSKSIKSPFILELTRLNIDLSNMKIYFRSNFHKRSKDQFADSFTEGGNIPLSHFMSFFENPFDMRFMSMVTTYNANIKIKDFEKFIEKKDIARLDRALITAELRFIHKFRTATYGPEVIVYYLFFKRNAVKNIRMIMSGKINGLSPNEIKRNLIVIE